MDNTTNNDKPVSLETNETNDWIIIDASVCRGSSVYWDNQRAKWKRAGTKTGHITEFSRKNVEEVCRDLIAQFPERNPRFFSISEHRNTPIGHIQRHYKPAELTPPPQKSKAGDVVNGAFGNHESDGETTDTVPTSPNDPCGIYNKKTKKFVWILDGEIHWVLNEEKPFSSWKSYPEAKAFIQINKLQNCEPRNSSWIREHIKKFGEQEFPMNANPDGLIGGAINPLIRKYQWKDMSRLDAIQNRIEAMNEEQKVYALKNILLRFSNDEPNCEEKFKWALNRIEMAISTTEEILSMERMISGE